jgi:hypothetical protein
VRVSWIEWEYIGYLEEKFEFGLLQEKGKKKLKQKREKKGKNDIENTKIAAIYPHYCGLKPRHYDRNEY